MRFRGGRDTVAVRTSDAGTVGDRAHGAIRWSEPYDAVLSAPQSPVVLSPRSRVDSTVPLLCPNYPKPCENSGCRAARILGAIRCASSRLVSDGDGCSKAGNPFEVPGVHQNPCVPALSQRAVVAQR
jgi:hypothetical protein